MARQFSNEVRGRDLPRFESRQLPGKHLPLREGEVGSPDIPSRGLREEVMAFSCVVPDVEPLPPRDLDPQGQPRGGYAVAAGHVLRPVQPHAR